MLMRIFVVMIILTGIAIGIGTRLSHEVLFGVIIIRDFFEAALPVLGFGALIKYLCSR